MSNKANTYRRRRAARKKTVNFKAIAISVAVALVCYAAAFSLDSFAPASSQPVAQGEYSAEALSVVTIPASTPQIMKDYEGFTVSFNPECHQPNYVVWELTGEESDGTNKRESNFRPDPSVPDCATLDDYRNSGYDRGHMAPAADMKWSREAMADCHYLTNICPQDHKLNSGRWSTLEAKSRTWAKRDSAIIIISGPILTDIMPRKIGKSEIPVPERFFKVILSPYSNPPRAIGFIVPNIPNAEGIEKLAVSVDQVEAITGFDFFSALPDSLENAIEARLNFRDFNRQTK
ncbi:MAG: DNA/RNA non-specific endonuclease [Bacteroidales bacterium]|nr:DNA/RNA non-specific endonuclease [Bacteroidales bacterium]